MLTLRSPRAGWSQPDRRELVCLCENELDLGADAMAFVRDFVDAVDAATGAPVTTEHPAPAEEEDPLSDDSTE